MNSNTNTNPVAAGDFEPLLVSRVVAAKKLGISVRSVDLLLADGRLDCVLIGGRVLVPMSVLVDFAAHGCSGRIRPARN
jgi:hypothetical protein